MINFIKNLFGLSLKSKVMKVIEKKINEAQKALDSEIAQLGKTKSMQNKSAVRNFDEAISNASFSYKYGVEQAEEKHVNSILSKII